MTATLFKVFVGEGSKAYAVLEAPEKDARKYIEDHFTRVHIQPGANVPPNVDAFLRSADGTEEHFHGPETGWVNPEATANLAASGGPVAASDAEEFQRF